MPTRILGRAIEMSPWVGLKLLRGLRSKSVWRSAIRLMHLIADLSLQYRFEGNFVQQTPLSYILYFKIHMLGDAQGAATVSREWAHIAQVSAFQSNQPLVRSAVGL